MNILLDECVPRKLAKSLPGHIVRTVTNLGWAGTRNGGLLRKAVEHGFDVLLTTDRRIRFQQHIPKFNIAVVVLEAKSNSLPDLRPLMREARAALARAKPGQVVSVSS